METIQYVNQETNGDVSEPWNTTQQWEGTTIDAHNLDLKKITLNDKYLSKMVTYYLIPLK